MDKHTAEAAMNNRARAPSTRGRAIGLMCLALAAPGSAGSAATPPAPPPTPDALSVEWNGKHPCEGLYEDAQIRVARCVFPPGAVHLRHTHPAYLTYVLSGGKSRTLTADGEREGQTTAGALLQNKPVTWHEFRNVGATTMSYLLVEKKYEAPAAPKASETGSSKPSSAAAADFMTVQPAQIAWKDVPGGHGAQSAELIGSPDKAGLYVVRLRVPPHVMDTPHWHSADRVVTVLEGVWAVGTGPKFDPASATRLPAGSVMTHPARGVHWDGAGGDTPVVVQIVGMGPVSTTRLDADGPVFVDLREKR